MRYYSSTATPKTLAGTVSDSVGQITLNNLTGLPTSYPYTLVIDVDTIKEEIVTVTSLASGYTVNVTRAQDGSSAIAHDAGAVIKHMATARDFAEPQAHANATLGVHGVTGSVVGTTDTQTLSGKTVSLGSNTLSGTKAQFNAAISDADMVTLDGTETLTNKTLTSPVLSAPDIAGTPLIRLIDAKGDLLPGSANNTPARLIVGSDGQVLTADAAEATGMKWATVAVGETLISTTSLTGSSVNLSSIPQTYKHLRLVLAGMTTTSSAIVYARPNNVSANCGLNSLRGSGLTALEYDLYSNTHTSRVSMKEFTIKDYTTARAHVVQGAGVEEFGGSLAPYFTAGTHNTAAAITSINIVLASGTFTAGTAYLYGVN